MKTMFALAALLAPVTLGCGASKPPVQPHDVAAPSTTPPGARAATSGTVQIDTDILRACGMSDADAYFSFDSSRLGAKDIGPLNSVAACFTSGALKGRSLRLVGRADPRGATEYNMTLGQARADAVAGYLDTRGMSNGKIQSTSRGALDAVGRDDPGWARDRRVDVLLGD